MRNTIIKYSFSILKKLVWRNTLKPSLYRKAMDFSTVFLPKPSQITWKKERIYAIPALWIYPSQYQPEQVFLYLHGGAYGMGSIQSHKKMAARIAKASQTQVLMIEYRLAPEYPYPAALEDAVSVYAYLLEKGFKPEHIVMGGDSAGGGLTIAALLKIRASGLPQPCAAVCLSPWLDLEAASEGIEDYQKADPFIDRESIRIWGQKYAGIHTADPFASPIHADLRGICPLLVQVGTAELLLCENRLFREKCQEMEVSLQYSEYVSQVHVFQVFAGFLPEANKAIAEIGVFVRQQFAPGKP